MLEQIAFLLAAIMVICGSLFSLLAAIGILRLPDFLTRTHAASKAGTMGAGLMFLSVAVVAFDGPVILRALVGFVFLLLTAPVASHLLAKAAYLAKTPLTPLTQVDEFKKYCEDKT